MWYPRRRPDPVEQLLRARFTVFVSRGGLLYMVSVTRLVVVARLFEGTPGGDPLKSWHFERRNWEQLHDGQGWNLAVLEKFLRSLGESCADDKETGVKQQRISKLYAHMALYTRRKQRGGSCLMLPCTAIRQFIPALSAETVKFYLLAAANGDDLGVAFGATDYFWGLGYHPEKSGKRMRELESLGLMRYLRKDAYDPITRRRVKDVYQFNPLLYYVRKARRAAALALSETPYNIMPTAESLIGSPDRKVRENPDRNQNLYPIPESSRTNQSQVSKSKNHHHHQNSAFEEGAEGRDWNRDADATPARIPAQSAKTKDQEPKAPTPAPNGATQTPAPNGAKTEPPPNSARPPSRRSDFEQPLADVGMERVAQEVKARCETRLWQARELVAEYGAVLVDRALEMVTAEKKKRYVKTEIGLMRYWLSKCMVKVEDQANYDPNDYGASFAAGD